MGLSRELGIDLGTFNTQIAEGNQILHQEPTVVAIVVNEMKLVEYGTTALGMMGRVPDSIEVIRPLRHGVIAEYELTEIFLRELIKKVTGPTLFFKPRLLISAPYGVTSVEKRAVVEAGLGSGGREVNIIPQPLAAAIGVDLPINTPTGNMIICLGAGTTQAAVVSMTGIVSAETNRTAGVKLDEALINYTIYLCLTRDGEDTANSARADAFFKTAGMALQGSDAIKYAFSAKPTLRA